MSLLLLFQPKPAPIVLTPGVIFHDAMNTSANYDAIGANTTFGGNTGMFGSLGACSSLRVTSSGTAYPFEGVKKSLSSAATVFQLYYRPATTATIGTGNSIFTVYQSAAYENASAPIRVDMRANATGFSLSLISPQYGYTTIQGTTVYPLGTAIRIVVAQDANGWKLYVNNNTTAEATFVQTQPIVGYGFIVVGQNNQNAAGSYTGIADFDELWCSNMAAAPSTSAARATDAYQGYLMKHLSAEGQPYRGPVDGANLTFGPGIDTVSEGAVYMLKLAVQNNDTASFKLCDNWILQNLLRSKSTIANTQNNPAPTTALNLMVFHYNSAQTDGKGIGTIYDANWAGDADPERAQALLWAHNRFGSSANAVGIAAELLAPNYLQRALDVIADLRTYAFVNSAANGYNYLVADAFQQGNATVQIGPDYMDPAAFKLFAQYDSANAAFWNNALLGTYDVLNKSADVIFSGNTPAQTTTAGLNPNWISFTVATAAVGTAPSTYGDNNYGFNAFRTYNRLNEMYVWYADAAALTPLRKPKTFFTNQYAGAGIKATYNHDGSNAATYENNMFNFAAYWTLYAGDASNTTAAGLNTNKLADTVTFNQAPFGSYYNAAPGSLQYAYFDQSWLITNYMQKNGSYINYGQAASAVTLLSTMAASASMTAAVNNSTGLASTMPATSTTTDAISNSTSVAASPAGTSTTTGAITNRTLLASSMAGTSTMIGACAVTNLITASMAAAANMSAAISNATTLTSTMAGSSSLIAAFAAGTQTLTVTMVATSSMSAAINSTTSVASTMAGSSTQTGAITNSTSLTDTMIATSTMSGSAAVVYPLASTMAGSSSMSAAIAVTEALASTMVATSSTTAAINAIKSLAASLPGTSTTSAAIAVTDVLAATMAASATMSDTISNSVVITATMPASANLTAAFGASSLPLTSTMPASASMAADVAGFVTYQLNSAMSAAANMSAALANATTLSDTMLGASNMSAALVMSTALASTMPATSNMSAALGPVIKALASTMVASSTMSATIGNIQSLTDTMAGSSNMSGAIAVVLLLASTMPGTSTMSAALAPVINPIVATMPGTSTMTAAQLNATTLAAALSSISAMSAAILVVSAQQPKYGSFVRLTSDIKYVTLTGKPTLAVSLTSKRSQQDSVALTGKPTLAVSLSSKPVDADPVYL